jgi:hypothetical protein
MKYGRKEEPITPAPRSRYAAPVGHFAAMERPEAHAGEPVKIDVGEQPIAGEGALDRPLRE